MLLGRYRTYFHNMADVTKRCRKASDAIGKVKAEIQNIERGIREVSSIQSTRLDTLVESMKALQGKSEVQLFPALSSVYTVHTLNATDRTRLLLEVDRVQRHIKEVERELDLSIIPSKQSRKELHWAFDVFLMSFTDVGINTPNMEAYRLERMVRAEHAEHGGIAP